MQSDIDATSSRGDRSSRVPPPVGDGWSSTPVMGRVLASLLGGGCALAMPAVLLDATPGSRKPLAFAVVCAGFVVATALFFAARSHRLVLRRGVVHGVLVAALGVVTTAVWCGNGGTTAVAALGIFAWPTLFAFAFFSWRLAMPYLVASSALNVAVVAVTVHQAPFLCVLESVGTAAASALTAGYLRSLLVRSSTTDSLTRLPNRQALPGLFERERARAERLGTALTVAIIDLDDFKAVNDSGGHTAGDEVLLHVARHWHRGLGHGDDIVRYGGDEFVVLFPGCDAPRAAEVADGLRRSGGRPCSVGVAEWRPGETVDATLARADTALYEAKAAGRDRVAVAPGRRPAVPAGPLGSPRLRRLPPATGPSTSTAGQSRAALRAELLGVLYVLAGAIALPGLLVDPIPHTDVTASLATCCVAVAVGTALVVVARRRGARLRMWTVHAGMTLAVAAMCTSVLLAHGALGGIASMGVMVWASMYVTALFPWRVAAVYLVGAGLVMTIVVLTTVRDNPVGVAFLSVGGTLGAGFVVGYLALVLRRHAQVDTLTGLLNRRALDDVLGRELALVARTRSPLAVAVVDLDHLKVVNDTRGHLAGDEALRSFADLWAGQLRATDHLVRYGGDEFVLVLPGCDLAGASELVERLRAAGAPPCSIGLTCWAPSDTAERLLARADAALYRAKADGRGRVAVLGAPGPPASRAG